MANLEEKPTYRKGPLKVPLVLLLIFGMTSLAAQLFDGGYGYMHLGLWATTTAILVGIIGLVAPDEDTWLSITALAFGVIIVSAGTLDLNNIRPAPPHLNTLADMTLVCQIPCYLMIVIENMRVIFKANKDKVDYTSASVCILCI